MTKAPATDMIFHALKTDNGFQTIWSPVKVAYGQSMRYGGISHRRGTTKRHSYFHTKTLKILLDDEPQEEHVDCAPITVTSSVMARNQASFFARRHNQKYRHGVLAEEKMEQFGKEKSSFHDQGHQQAAKGKEDDEEFGEIRWFATPAGNPVKKILLKLNLSNHRSILTDSKEYFKMVIEVPDSSRLTRFIATCSYPTDKYKDIMKAQVHVSRLLLI
ncbi:hypothetical protein Tco_0327400 [Tanacetum coccineum]